LKLLDVFVGEGSEKGEVGGISPETDFKEFNEQELFSFITFLRCVGGVMDGGFVREKGAVTGGEFEDGGEG
jgi:hypothetical protein